MASLDAADEQGLADGAEVGEGHHRRRAGHERRADVGHDVGDRREQPQTAAFGMPTARYASHVAMPTMALTSTSVRR